MILQTVVKVPSAGFKLENSDSILSLGSCFADNFGEAYQKLQLPVWSNPFGNVFNVASLYDVLLQTQSPYTNDYQLLRDELYVDYRYHTDIHADSPAALKEKIEGLNGEFLEFLKTAKCLIVTLGTSWVYRLKSADKIVANCHKHAAGLFEKVLLDEKTQAEYLEKIIGLVRTLNPAIAIILTVSPVRHTKDGLVENSVSKAILRLLTASACEKYDFVHYFPAYEILLDELRDYRYYAEDLIHPSAVAVDYILSRFEETYFSEAYRENIKKRMAIKTALEHRPLNAASAAHKRFLENIEKEINAVGWVK